MVSPSLQSDPSGYLKSNLNAVKQSRDSVRAPLVAAGRQAEEVAEEAGPIRLSVALASEFPIFGIAPAIAGISYLATTQRANALLELTLKFDSGPARLLVAPPAQNGLQDLLADQGDDKKEFNISELIKRLEDTKTSLGDDKGSIEILNKMISTLKKKQSGSTNAKNSNSTEVQITVESANSEDSERPTKVEGPIITKEEFKKLFESFIQGTPYAEEYAKAKEELNPTLSITAYGQYFDDRLKTIGDIASKHEKATSTAFFKALNNVLGDGQQA